jgi:hypothetical protein
MAHPIEGEPFTVRRLAAEAGISPSKIQALRDGTRSTVSAVEAARIAGAVHFRPRALFHPVSMSRDMDKDPVTRREGTQCP